ncbi:MAG TPA: hypothetical protein VHD62_12550 [Opitutaceae bacterium]|nr:hypothetical protein [Opitutaceae bacterium]
MTPTDHAPKLPLWIFLLTDALLVATAALIFHSSRVPLSNAAIFSIVACVIAGAIVLFIPLIAHYERQKNETLDDRQRALEALARTVSSSAEQISIAVGGLSEITEHVQKTLRHAEHLPHKLQEKIAEFQSQLDNANDAEKEELEKELVALRSADSDRLDSVATRVSKAVAELGKLEAATQQHLTAANEAVGKLSFGTAAAIGKAQVAAEQALATARTEAARGLGEAAGQATRAIETAKAAALAEIDARFAAAAHAFVERVTRDLGAKSADSVSAAAVTPPAPVERPRKSRRDAAPEESAPAPAAAAPEISSAPAPKLIAAVDEPPPIPAEKISPITPIAPATAEPFNGQAPAAPAAMPAPAAAEPAAKAPRKRPPRKTESEVAAAPAAEPSAEKKDEPSLGLALDDPAPAAEPGEKTLSSDGATRLIVTAYIGIGNRLFIRGAGPGLTWEKGIPLQFVSIGKWRWETNDATAPVQFKLYKNDELECAALGAQSIDPGYQQEVSASF